MNFNIILIGPEMIEKFQYRFQRTKINPDATEDVYNGELNKRHSCSGGFLSDPHNISFLGNTDGVTLIKSNGYGVWPVCFTINDISPLERMVSLVAFHNVILTISLPPGIAN